jgi:hypothetical protein
VRYRGPVGAQFDVLQNAPAIAVPIVAEAREPLKSAFFQHPANACSHSEDSEQVRICDTGPWRGELGHGTTGMCG